MIQTYVFFHAGISNEGCWNSSYAKIQLKDVIDCLKVIYPGFDVAYLYDQSSWPTKIRTDGLSVNNMNVAPGGAVPSMRSTIVSELGQYTTNMSIEDEQEINFGEDDLGPFGLSDNLKLFTKYDKNIGPILKRDYTKGELFITLRCDGYDTTKKMYLKPELIMLCEQWNIQTTKDEAKVIDGWCSKPKGMLKKLYERGYIDKDKLSHPRSISY